jgi:lysozyme family protein
MKCARFWFAAFGSDVLTPPLWQFQAHYIRAGKSRDGDYYPEQLED